jgi:hypothetical protein
MTPQEVDDGAKVVEVMQGPGLVIQRAIGECIRCGGFLVATRYMDLEDDTGQLEFVAERCVQCGDVVDPVIHRNRSKQLLARANGKKVQRQTTEFMRWVA